MTTIPLDAILNDLPEKKIPAGAGIFHQGQVCENYFILMEGSARIFTRSVAGKEVVLYHVEPGDMCVLTTSCLLSSQTFPAEAVAESDMRVKVMPKKQFDELVDNCTEFREFVFKSFGSRLTNLIGTIEKLALESIEQRLAKFLLLQPDNHITTTHQQVALEIGSAREVVSRHLKRFESEGWITLGRGHIQLLDRQSLHAHI